MQGSISSLQDAKVLFLKFGIPLPYMFLGKFFLEKMQDLKLSYAWQNFESRSYNGITELEIFRPSSRWNNSS